MSDPPSRAGEPTRRDPDWRRSGDPAGKPAADCRPAGAVHARSYAVVPAAGNSTRMGRPKLLLPWTDGTVIEHCLAAWRAGGVTEVIVVVSPADCQLARVVQTTGARVVIPPQPPPDMKSSVRHGLQFVEASLHPDPGDAWLLAPADMPLLPARVVSMLLHEHQRSGAEILVPRHRGRRGHPVLFPWSLAVRLEALAADQGINAIVRAGPTRMVDTDEHDILADLDTPDDYQRLRNLYDA
jgi:molybdenum cofactor cytidylyltransferase